MSKPKVMGAWKSDDVVRTGTGRTVRGKPISSPIPFPDTDEFPFRTHGPSISLSCELEDIEKQLLQEPPAAAEPPSLPEEEEKDAPADDKSIESLAEIPPQPSYDAPAPPIRQPSQVRISAPALSSNVAAEKPKRRKSSLRAVLGKLFGKKSKESRPSRLPQQGTTDIRAGAHRSDPTPLKSTTKNDSPPQQRSVSLPINELERILRPHSTSTEDFRFPLTPNLNRGSVIQGDGKSKDDQDKPRRATLSGVWSPSRVPGYTDWTGLSPRPASSHARGSRAGVEEENEGAVGIALTSGSHPKRRSRSAGELRALTTSGFNVNGRADGARYWADGERRAMLPLTPTIIETDHSAVPLTPSTVEGRSPVVPFTPSIKEAAEVPILHHEEDAAEEEVPESPKPFSFGPMIEMARKTMIQNNTLQERMQKLETRMNEMETTMNRQVKKAVAEQLAGQDLTRKGLERERSPSSTRPRTGNSELSLPGQQKFQDAQQPRVSKGLMSQSSGKASSYDSRRPSTISTNTSDQPSSDNEQFPQSLTSADQKIVPTHQNMARPLSNSTTIRGFSSTPPKSLNDSIQTDKNYTSLLNMILAEREARQDLEVVVLKLQQRLQTIAWTSSPGPGSTTAKPLGEGGDRGQFLDLEHDDSSLDDGKYSSEDFRTPNEETGLFGDEIFGDVLHNKTAVKTAPRVVSLSRMTLGRGAQPSLGF